MDVLDFLASAGPPDPLPPYEQDLRELLGETLSRIERKDRHAKRLPAHERHRLAVLLDCVKVWTSGNDDSYPINPLVALNELGTTLQIFRHWQSDALWPSLRPRLKSSEDYAHNLVTLALTQHLQKAGMPISLHPESGTSRACDLRLAPPSGKGALNIEVKVPRDLLWPTEPLTPERALYHVKKQFHSAKTGDKGQLPPPDTGVLALGGLSLDPETCYTLELAGASYLENPPGDYSHIWGIIFIWIGHRLNVSMQEVAERQTRVTTMLESHTEIQLVANPSYTGPIRFSTTDGTIPLFDNISVRMPPVVMKV